MSKFKKAKLFVVMTLVTAATMTAGTTSPARAGAGATLLRVYCRENCKKYIRNIWYTIEATMAEQSLTKDEKKPIIVIYKPQNSDVLRACKAICQHYPGTFGLYDAE